MLVSAVIICDNRNTIILALSCDRINIRILWENNTLNKIAIKITEFELKKMTGLAEIVIQFNTS
jgi:hypothetical protein